MNRSHDTWWSFQVEAGLELKERILCHNDGRKQSHIGNILVQHLDTLHKPYLLGNLGVFLNWVRINCPPSECHSPRAAHSLRVCHQQLSIEYRQPQLVSDQISKTLLTMVAEAKPKIIDSLSIKGARVETKQYPVMGWTMLKSFQLLREIIILKARQDINRILITSTTF